MFRQRDKPISWSDDTATDNITSSFSQKYPPYLPQLFLHPNVEGASHTRCPQILNIPCIPQSIFDILHERSTKIYFDNAWTYPYCSVIHSMVYFEPPKPLQSNVFSLLFLLLFSPLFWMHIYISAPEHFASWYIFWALQLCSNHIQQLNRPFHDKNNYQGTWGTQEAVIIYH